MVNAAMGILLFEICYDLVYNGKPGRPKKTFKRGGHVSIKNKGAQAHKKVANDKYQSPWREHPETARTGRDGHPCQSYRSVLSVPCAENVPPFDGRPTCNNHGIAEAITGVHWVVHNFLRVHFTIREVPAVALGILRAAVWA